MRRVALVMALLLYPVRCSAIELRESVQSKGEVSRAFIMIVESGIVREVEGRIVTRNGERFIHAEAGELSKSALVGGVAELSDGSVVSSPFHRLDSLAAPSAERKLAMEVGVLTGSRNRAEREIRSLEGELYLATLQARKAAGLGEVDKVREQIEWAQEELRSMERGTESWPSQVPFNHVIPNLPSPRDGSEESQGVRD